LQAGLLGLGVGRGRELGFQVRHAARAREGPGVAVGQQERAASSSSRNDSGRVR
jgi:hypothetical protein